MPTQKLPIIHPGEILLEEFMKPLAITGYRLAKSTGIPHTRIADIVHERRAITADTALRLALFFGNSAQFWMNLQTGHDLRVTQKALGKKLDHDVRPRAVA